MTIDGRAHSLALAARLMRQILVDHARRRAAVRRGGDVQLVSLDEADAIAQPAGVDILALDEALDEMASFDARQLSGIPERA